jgi:peptide-methionine (R)-S-oxide reductase
MIEKIRKTEEEWKKILTPEQFHVMREKGTEAPFACVLENLGGGICHCAACDLELFVSSAKFESGTGWPSFFEPFAQGHLEYHEDDSHGMHRTEVLCARCESHLGHVFDDLPRQQAGGPLSTGKPGSRASSLLGKRYCINSIAFKFKPRKA